MLSYFQKNKKNPFEEQDTPLTAFELGVFEAVNSYKLVLPVIMTLMAMTSLGWYFDLTADRYTRFGLLYLSGYLYLLIASAVMLVIIYKCCKDFRKHVSMLNEIQMTFSWMLLIWAGVIATLDALIASPTFNGMLFMACEFLVVASSFMKPRRWVTIQVVTCGIMLNAFRIMPLVDKTAHISIFAGFIFASIFGGRSLLKSKWENYKRQEELSKNLNAVKYDILTGLYTQQAFYHQARKTLNNNPNVRYDLLMSDIENFKRINQMYGEETGDKLLKHTGEFLKQAQSPDVIIGRYGDDRFVCLMKHNEEYSNDESLITLLANVSKNGPVPDVTTKFGIYDDVPHDQPISILCDCAYTSLKTIKHQYGRIVAKYDAIIQSEQLRTQQLEDDMKIAIEDNQFKVFYQPKHEVSTGKLIGAEALLRWNHPVLGSISPDEFIPLFERSGYICSADKYVWNNTCANLKKWRDKGLNNVPISVNLSKRDFENSNLPSDYFETASKIGISSDLLSVEVTESLFSDHEEEMCSALEQFHSNGFLVALDDFGTGYSSLNLLGCLPIDIIKFDMSFMRTIYNERRVKVFSLCVQMAKSLGMYTIAEGVETDAQLNILRSTNCDAVQGFYYSRPLSETDFEKYLERHVSSTI